jgi:SAM-dependent methyltransferase
MSTSENIREFLKKYAPPLAWVVRKTRWFIRWRRAGLPLGVEMAARRDLNLARSFERTPKKPVNNDASEYVGTNPEEGIAELAVLITHGCRPEHQVLEIGCGALNAGYPVIQYLNAGNYRGVDPNRWLIEDSLKNPRVQEAVAAKGAGFDYNADFRGDLFGMKFDYVLSHSVLSHAAHWQWEPFLQNLDKCVRPGSLILASLHFTEGNEFGDAGYAGTEMDFKEWVYPGITYFRKETIFNLTKDLGYEARTDLVAPMLITSTNPSSNHSWIVLRKK